jgi:multiple sugar transport system ATP-binding protein
MASVRLESIARRYETTTAVADIDFTIPDGQFWVFVGPSGCGKSTILRMIAGLDLPTSGQIWIGNQLVNGIPARQRDVAMVFQNYALYPHMSVAENLAFGLKMRQMEVGQIQDRVLTVAKSLDIAHLLPRKPKQLSGGQQQRVALGRAIARSPQVFLLDEPLSNLDAQLRDEMRAELKQLHHQIGITTIYVTHDQVEAMTLADQIVVLNQGKIQQIGTPQQVYNQPANQMVATFLGTPPMNLLNVTYNQGQFHLTPHQIIPCPPYLPPNLNAHQSLALGIRPEHLSVTSSDEPASDSVPSLRVQVTLVEPLGRENLIRTHLWDDHSQILNLIVSSHVYPQTGELLAVRFEPDNLHVFDPTTSKRLVAQK